MLKNWLAQSKDAGAYAGALYSELLFLAAQLTHVLWRALHGSPAVATVTQAEVARLERVGVTFSAAQLAREGVRLRRSAHGSLASAVLVYAARNLTAGAELPLYSGQHQQWQSLFRSAEVRRSCFE